MTATDNPASITEKQTLVQKIIEWIGATGVVVLLLGAGFSKAAQNIGMALALLAVIAMVLSGNGKAVWQFVRNDRFAWLVGAWILYLILLSLGIHWFASIPAEDLPKETWRLSRLFLIVLVAFWVSRSFTNPITAIWVLLAGYVVGSVMFHSDAGWPIAFDSRRLDLWENPQFYGLLSGAALITLIVFARDLIGTVRSKLFWLRAPCWTIAMLLSVNGFLISEARGSMVGLVLATLIIVILVLGHYILNAGKATNGSHKRFAITALSAFAIMAVIATAAWDRVADRFQHDGQVLIDAMESPEDIQRSSIGIRLVQWQTAGPLWQERPLWGWGPGSGDLLHGKADLSDEFRSGGEHFHNSYLDLLLWTGLAGTAIFISAFVVMIHRIGKNSPGTGILYRVRLWAVGVTALFVAAAFTQTFLTSQVSWFFLGSYLGTAYGLVHGYRAKDRTPINDAETGYQ